MAMRGAMGETLDQWAQRQTFDAIMCTHATLWPEVATIETCAQLYDLPDHIAVDPPSLSKPGQWAIVTTSIDQQRIISMAVKHSAFRYTPTAIP